MFQAREPQESLWQSEFLITPRKAKLMVWHSGEASGYEDARSGEGHGRLSVCAQDVYRLVGYVEARGSGSLSTSRPWRVTSSEWSGHGWTRCWSHRLPWRPLSPLHEATGAVASPLMPTRTEYGAPQLPHRPQHKPRPQQPNPSRLTTLTPQNQPERPLLPGNQDYSPFARREIPILPLGGSPEEAKRQAERRVTGQGGLLYVVGGEGADRALQADLQSDQTPQLSG